MNAKAVLNGIVAFSALVLTGCGAISGGDGAGESAEPDAAEPTTFDEVLVGVAEMYRIDNPPIVEPIREITPAESLDVINACLVERGWAMSDGTFTYPEEQDEAFRRDSYICTASYPIRQEYLAPLDAAAWSRVYDFWQTATLPCLRAEGIVVSDPPTKETFIANPTWTPDGALVREQVEALVAEGKYPDAEHVFTDVCPVSPPPEVRLGD